jgi:hypothetical protein
MKWTTLSLTTGSDIVGELEGRLGANAGPFVVEGFGELRDPVLWPRTEDDQRTEIQLTGVWDLVSLRGAGETPSSVTLVALLCRQSQQGPETRGGVLAGGSIVSAKIRIGAGSDNAQQSQPPPRSQPPLVALQAAAPVVPTPTPRPAEAAPAPPPALAVVTPPPAAHVAPPAPAGAPSPAFGSSGTLPKRPAAVDTSVESYPEEGDIANHFAFGRCTVVSSDGERLRLQQERDGRVREVALSMLRVGSPVMVDGKRHWELARKN